MRPPAGGDGDLLDAAPADVPDAPLADAGPADAYDLARGWSPAVALDVLNSPVADDDPSLTGDLLEIYFSSDRFSSVSAGKNIYVATRTTATSPWNAPALVDELSSDQHDDTPEVSLDGLRLYFSRFPAGAADTTIYFTSRTSRGAPWDDPPTNVAALNSPYEEHAPVVVAGGTKAYFCSTRPSGASADIFVSGWSGAGFSTPEREDALSASGYDCSVWVNMGDTLAIFSSDRGGDGNDLWWSWRAAPSDPFPEPIRLDALSSELGDEDPWLSPDGRAIYFTRGSVGNGRELMVSTR